MNYSVSKLKQKDIEYIEKVASQSANQALETIDTMYDYVDGAKYHEENEFSDQCRDLFIHTVIEAMLTELNI